MGDSDAWFTTSHHTKGARNVWLDMKCGERNTHYCEFDDNCWGGSATRGGSVAAPSHLQACGGLISLAWFFRFRRWRLVAIAAEYPSMSLLRSCLHSVTGSNQILFTFAPTPAGEKLGAMG